VARGEYYDGAIEFHRYAARLRENPHLTFMYEGSMRFQDSDQLVRLRLMKDSDAWKHRRTDRIEPEAMGIR
jgi:hypothetical protein